MKSDSLIKPVIENPDKGFNKWLHPVSKRVKLNHGKSLMAPKTYFVWRMQMQAEYHRGWKKNNENNDVSGRYFPYFDCRHINTLTVSRDIRIVSSIVICLVHSISLAMVQ